MKSQSHVVSYRFALAFFAVLSLHGCSSASDTFPQIANPPPFDYADGEELRSGMHQLAFELQRLDMSLAEAYVDQPSFQREIAEGIRNIERIAGYVRESDLSVRHPFLMGDMDRFLSDVRRARMDAERSIPRYYMAGRVSGGCITCHRENR